MGNPGSECSAQIGRAHIFGYKERRERREERGRCLEMVIRNVVKKGPPVGDTHVGESRGAVGFVGLLNQGATCYLNSLLQSLYMTPELRRGVFSINPLDLGVQYVDEYEKEEKMRKTVEPDEGLLDTLMQFGFNEHGAARALIAVKNESVDTAIEYYSSHSEDPGFCDAPVSESKAKKRKPRQIPLELQQLFTEMQLLDERALSTAGLTQKGFQWQGMDGRVQHDAHELSRLLVDALERSLKNLPGNSSAESLVSSLYRGELAYRTVCETCKTVSDRTENFYDLLVQVSGHPDLVSSLTDYVAVERLEGESAYHCDVCAQKDPSACKQPASRGVVLSQLPPILTLSCSRFKLDRSTNWQREKVVDRCAFPLVLDMSPFLDDGDGVSVHRPGDSGADETQDTVSTALGCARGSQRWLNDAVASAKDLASQLVDAHISSGKLTPRSGDENVDDIKEGGEDAVGKLQWAMLTEAEQRIILARMSSFRANGSAMNNLEYELHSVIMHRGSAHAGHYFAYIRDSLREGSWVPPGGGGSERQVGSGDAKDPTTYLLPGPGDVDKSFIIAKESGLGNIITAMKQPSSREGGPVKPWQKTRKAQVQTQSSSVAMNGINVDDIGRQMKPLFGYTWTQAFKSSFGNMIEFMRTPALSNIFSFSGPKNRVAHLNTSITINLIDPNEFARARAQYLLENLQEKPGVGVVDTDQDVSNDEMLAKALSDSLNFNIDASSSTDDNKVGSHVNAANESAGDDGIWNSVGKKRQKNADNRGKPNSRGRSNSPRDSKQSSIKVQFPADQRAAAKELLSIEILSKTVGNFFEFNDSTVTPMHLHSIEKAFEGRESAYILVYRRVDSVSDINKLSANLSAPEPPEHWKSKVVERNADLRDRREAKALKENTVTVRVLLPWHVSGCDGDPMLRYYPHKLSAKLNEPSHLALVPPSSVKVTSTLTLLEEGGYVDIELDRRVTLGEASEIVGTRVLQLLGEASNDGFNVSLSQVRGCQLQPLVSHGATAWLPQQLRCSRNNSLLDAILANSDATLTCLFWNGTTVGGPRGKKLLWGATAQLTDQSATNPLGSVAISNCHVFLLRKAGNSVATDFHWAYPGETLLALCERAARRVNADFSLASIHVISKKDGGTSRTSGTVNQGQLLCFSGNTVIPDYHAFPLLRTSGAVIVVEEVPMNSIEKIRNSLHHTYPNHERPRGSLGLVLPNSLASEHLRRCNNSIRFTVEAEMPVPKYCDVGRGIATRCFQSSPGRSPCALEYPGLLGMGIEGRSIPGALDLPPDFRSVQKEKPGETLAGFEALPMFDPDIDPESAPTASPASSSSYRSRARSGSFVAHTFHSFWVEADGDSLVNELKRSILLRIGARVVPWAASTVTSQPLPPLSSYKLSCDAPVGRRTVYEEEEGETINSIIARLKSEDCLKVPVGDRGDSTTSAVFTLEDYSVDPQMSGANKANSVHAFSGAQSSKPVRNLEITVRVATEYVEAEARSSCHALASDEVSTSERSTPGLPITPERQSRVGNSEVEVISPPKPPDADADADERPSYKEITVVVSTYETVQAFKDKLGEQLLQLTTGWTEGDDTRLLQRMRSIGSITHGESISGNGIDDGSAGKGNVSFQRFPSMSSFASGMSVDSELDSTPVWRLREISPNSGESKRHIGEWLVDVAASVPKSQASDGDVDIKLTACTIAESKLTNGSVVVLEKGYWSVPGLLTFPLYTWPLNFVNTPASPTDFDDIAPDTAEEPASLDTRSWIGTVLAHEEFPLWALYRGAFSVINKNSQKAALEGAKLGPTFDKDMSNPEALQKIDIPEQVLLREVRTDCLPGRCLWIESRPVDVSACTKDLISSIGKVLPGAKKSNPSARHEEANASLKKYSFHQGSPHPLIVECPINARCVASRRSLRDDCSADEEENNAEKVPLSRQSEVRPALGAMRCWLYQLQTPTEATPEQLQSSLRHARMTRPGDSSSIWPPMEFLLDVGQRPSAGQLKSAAAKAIQEASLSTAKESAPDINTVRLLKLNFQKATWLEIAPVSKAIVDKSKSSKSQVLTFDMGNNGDSGNKSASAAAKKRADSANVCAPPISLAEGDLLCAVLSNEEYLPTKLLEDYMARPIDSARQQLLTANQEKKALKRKDEAEKRREEFKQHRADTRSIGGAAASRRDGVSSKRRNIELALSIGGTLDFSDEEN